MKYVRKGNKQLRIQDDRLDGYLASGYAEIDRKTGKVITPPSTEEDNRSDSAVKKENKALQAKVAELEKKLAEAAPPGQ